MKKRIAIFISGRGSNMEAILQNMEEGELGNYCEVALVFSNKEEAAGLHTARGYGFATSCIKSKGKQREDFDQEVVDLLEPLKIDYIVLAGFMRILSPVIIKRYHNRIINIHPADTVEFQGVGAYNWAFENKKEETKVTVHFVDEGVDTGPVIGKKVVDLRGASSLEEVEKRGLAIEHQFYSKALLKVFSGGFQFNQKDV
jgi:phosphoribosylglycinamide formyltransferase-1